MPQGPDDDRVSRIPVPDGRMHVARDGDAIVGGAGVFPFDLTVPGGPMPTAGVTVVGVLPTHRRRGILRELMRAQLDDIHERGEPLAALWASEGSIYGRFGYGLSSLCGDMEIQRTDAAFARPVDWGGTSRLVDRDEALRLFPPVYDRVAGRDAGDVLPHRGTGGRRASSTTRNGAGPAAASSPSRCSSSTGSRRRTRSTG